MIVEIQVKTEQDDDSDVEMNSKPVIVEVVKENAPGTQELPRENIKQEVIQQEVAQHKVVPQEVVPQEAIQQENVNMEPVYTVMEDAPQMAARPVPALSCKHPVMHLNELRKGLEYNLVAEEDEGKEKMYTYAVYVDGERSYHGS
ncbi:hypothetical protein KUTeg_015611 [Tegillarca granosa]|uniref:Uncharacterized protein n=1 Tax=Tegillarca granosa TaxID=220873 RepID=A0ABQ9EVB6_TEGGR|nr:hypothetical protein KUTeg_015611 [Tegillarca granosa]